MKTITFFNNKGGVGKTTLIYHLSWMLADLGMKVVAADLDPQANLTSMFLTEERLEELWPERKHTQSIMGALSDLMDGIGDIHQPHIERINENLGLIVGDLELAGIEDELSEQWPKCLDGQKRAFLVTSALYRILDRAANESDADVVLIDVGPNLGAINRTAVLASNYIGVPLAPDLYSLQGLRNLGPTLRSWREGWTERVQKSPDKTLLLPKGDMKPIGYVIMQHAVRYDRPVLAYKRWADKIPNQYRSSLLNIQSLKDSSNTSDPNCLAQLKHYRSLMPMSMEAHKPMFSLRPADGAIGAHSQAVTRCYDDFKALAQEVAAKCHL